MSEPVAAYIALGANLGEQPQQTLAAACREIAALPATRIVAHSSCWRTAPIDAAGPDFYNAVIALHTAATPEQLLAQLQRIEQNHGRERPYPNAPRTLDLDILLFGQQTVCTPTLTIPHPRMQQRAFVLLPLAEIAPEWVSAAWLQDVAAQRIERLQGDWLDPAQGRHLH